MKAFSASILTSEPTEVMMENTADVVLERHEPKSFLATRAENIASYNEALIARYDTYMYKPFTEAARIGLNDKSIALLSRVADNIGNLCESLKSASYSDPIVETVLGRFDTTSDVLSIMRSQHPNEWATLKETAYSMTITTADNSVQESVQIEKAQATLDHLSNMIVEVCKYMSTIINSGAVQEAAKEGFVGAMTRYDSLIRTSMMESDQVIRRSTSTINAGVYLFESTIAEGTTPIPVSAKLDYSNIEASVHEFKGMMERAYEKLTDIITENTLAKSMLQIEALTEKLGDHLSYVNELQEKYAAEMTWQYNAVLESVIRIADGATGFDSDHGDQGVLESTYDMDSIFTEFYHDIDGITDRMSCYIEAVRSEAITKEASIMEDSSMSSNEKTIAMQSLNEAIGEKIKSAWNNTMETLKSLFNKFMEKLRANFTTTKHYLDQYKNIILEKNFSNNEYGTQDLKTGIKNILQTNIPVIDFNSMKRDLASPGTFFTKRIKSGLHPTKGDPALSNDPTMQEITDFWKSYFCMQNHDTKISGQQFQRDIKYYYDFLYDISKIERACRKTLKDVEDTIKNIMKQAGTNIPANKPNNNQQQTTTPTESFYSYIRGSQVFFEVEKLGTPDQQKAVKQTANANKSGVNNLQNVNGSRDDVKDDKKIQRTEANLMDTYCTNYVNNASAMMKAKMSACEFIRNEAMAIIRDHVQQYVGNNNDNNTDTIDRSQSKPKEGKPGKVKEAQKASWGQRQYLKGLEATVNRAQRKLDKADTPEKKAKWTQELKKAKADLANARKNIGV